MKSLKSLNKQLTALIYHQGIGSDTNQIELMEDLKEEIKKSIQGYFWLGFAVASSIILIVSIVFK